MKGHSANHLLGINLFNPVVSKVIPKNISIEEANICRQAIAGLLWSKQHYFYNMDIKTKGNSYLFYLTVWRIMFDYLSAFILIKEKFVIILILSFHVDDELLKISEFSLSLECCYIETKKKNYLQTFIFTVKNYSLQ